MGDAAASGVKAGVASPNAAKEFPGEGRTINTGPSGPPPQSGNASAPMAGSIGQQATAFAETDIQTVSSGKPLSLYFPRMSARITKFFILTLHCRSLLVWAHRGNMLFSFSRLRAGTWI